MLLTFRLFLGAAGFVILALAVVARGLVPAPEVRTRVGEVPSVGRSLVQQTMIPPAFIDLADGPTRTRAEEFNGSARTVRYRGRACAGSRFCVDCNEPSIRARVGSRVSGRNSLA